LQDTCTNCKSIKNSSTLKNTEKNCHIVNCDYADNKKYAKAQCNAKNLQNHKINIKSNTKKIFAIIFALWLFVVMFISQIGIINFVQSTNADSSGESSSDSSSSSSSDSSSSSSESSGSSSYNDQIVIVCDSLNEDDCKRVDLENTGWSCATITATNDVGTTTTLFGFRYIVHEVRTSSDISMDTTQVDLPIAKIEAIGGKTKFKTTFGGVDKVYTNSNCTMSGYDFGDFSSTNDKFYDGTFKINGDGCYALFVYATKICYSIDLTISFENIQYQGTSTPLYVFDNDTNEILSTNSIVQSSSSTLFSISFDAEKNVRVTLAVPYLWDIEWSNVENFAGKSAVVDVSSNMTISAKVKVVGGYNNIIFV